ncbi:MAG: nucleotide exchange factor GrpE [Oscillospiraceae bacterium]|nr:nucleotide exchange factor GrpE [Oscillospiraceae bacterium]
MDERKDEELREPETEAEDSPEEQAAAAEGSAAEPEAAEPEHGKEKGFRGARAARREAELKKELEQLKEERDAALGAEKDKYLRLAAEYDNYRKRSQKERETVYADAKADTVLQLLPVYDNLERALKAECSDGAFYKGVEMIMDQLMGIFAKLGVEVIQAEGQTFDPALHNAVIHVEDESLGENVVAEEFQKGFTLNGKVIRFAMVKVAN